jgi:hypothetical protein
MAHLKPSRPRIRYRRKGALQDTVVLELHVAAALIPWLEFWSAWFGPSVEDTAKYLLISRAMQLQEQGFGRR